MWLFASGSRHGFSPKELFVVLDEKWVSDAAEAARVIEGSGLTQVGMSGLTPMSDRSDCSFYSPVAPTSPCDQGFGYE